MQRFFSFKNSIPITAFHLSDYCNLMYCMLPSSVTQYSKESETTLIDRELGIELTKNISHPIVCIFFHWKRKWPPVIAGALSAISMQHETDFENGYLKTDLSTQMPTVIIIEWSLRSNGLVQNRLESHWPHHRCDLTEVIILIHRKLSIESSNDLPNQSSSIYHAICRAACDIFQYLLP